MSRFLQAVLSALIVCVVFASASPASANTEDDLTLEQIPAAVRDAIEREAKGGFIDDIELELLDGQQVYEVEINRALDEVSLLIAADGSILRARVEPND
jgi:uncharacterized membrane protein YkoI